MTRSAPPFRQRRRDALAVFEHFGFEEGKAAPAGAASCARFARSLNSLGPLLQSFSRYLGSRADLLTAADREQFTAAPRVERAINPETVTRILRRELGALSELIELSTAPGEPATPRASWPLCVVVPARLEGAPVLVKLLRREAEQAVVDDLDLLTWVAERRLLGSDCQRVDLGSAAAGFLERLPLLVDLREERRSLERLASERATVPSFDEAFSSRRLIVYEDVGAAPLSLAGRSAGDAQLESCRQVMTTWLELLFCDGALIEEPEAGLVDLLDGGLVISGGTWHRLDSRTLALLERYLLAAVDGRADRAHRILTQLTAEPEPSSRPDEISLRAALRQAVPYRDHGLPESRLVPVLLDSALLHARLLHNTDHVPSRALLAFYRALTFLERLQMELSPDDDAFLAAMRRYRVLRAARSVRDAASPRRLLSAVSQTLPAVVDLVERLDEDDVVGASGEGRRRRVDIGPSYPIAVVLLAVALLMVGIRWLELVSAAGLARLVAAVLLGVGLLLLVPWRKGGARR